jgi:hypothetical protein
MVYFDAVTRIFKIRYLRFSVSHLVLLFVYYARKYNVAEQITVRSLYTAGSEIICPYTSLNSYNIEKVSNNDCIS